MADLALQDVQRSEGGVPINQAWLTKKPLRLVLLTVETRTCIYYSPTYNNLRCYNVDQAIHHRLSLQILVGRSISDPEKYCGATLVADYSPVKGSYMLGKILRKHVCDVWPHSSDPQTYCPYI